MSLEVQGSETVQATISFQLTPGSLLTTDWKIKLPSKRSDIHGKDLVIVRSKSVLVSDSH